MFFLFDPIRVCNRILPDWLKKVPKVTVATRLLENLETVLDGFWRNLQVILTRGRPISNIFGAKAHVNVFIGTFQRAANHYRKVDHALDTTK